LAKFKLQQASTSRWQPGRIDCLNQMVLQGSPALATAITVSGLLLAGLQVIVVTNSAA
jgi:hypothetical protein